MEKPTFPELIQEIHEAEDGVFSYHDREISLDPRNFSYYWDKGRVLRFYSKGESSRWIVYSGIEVSASYSIPSAEALRRSVFEAQHRAAPCLSVSIHTPIGGGQRVTRQSPCFTEQDLDYVDGKSGLKKYHTFNPDDPFITLLTQLLAAAKKPLDAQKGIAEAVRELGLIQ